MPPLALRANLYASPSLITLVLDAGEAGEYDPVDVLTLVGPNLTTLQLTSDSPIASIVPHLHQCANLTKLIYLKSYDENGDSQDEWESGEYVLDNLVNALSGPTPLEQRYLPPLQC